MTPPNPPTLAQVLEVAREVVRLDGLDDAFEGQYRGPDLAVPLKAAQVCRTSAPALARYILAMGTALEEWRAARKAQADARAAFDAAAHNPAVDGRLVEGYRNIDAAARRARDADAALLTACDRADADATARAEPFRTLLTATTPREG